MQDLGGCHVDLERRVVVHPDREHALSDLEVRLLAYLGDRVGQVVPREELYTAVWGHPRAIDTRALDFTVARLRRKIERRPSDPTILVTRAGEGVVLSPSRHAPEPPSGLVPPIGPLVGRFAEIATATDHLVAHPGLLTLVGTGGVGKTRLAQQIAWVSRSTWAEALWHETNTCRTASELCASVGRALGVSSEGAWAERIGDALRGRGKLLLILDNLEQLHPDATGLVGAWIRTAPSLRVLATSRRALGIEGERCVPVSPLSQEEAVTLFLLRSGAERTAELTELVDLLDRIPLALELAASRAWHAPIAVLHTSLRERLETLRSTDNDRPERHQTLDQLIAWSWDLLNDAERDALASLAVFAGAFNLDAADAILGGRTDPLNVVERLVGHNLLTARDADGGLSLVTFDAVRRFVVTHNPRPAAHERHLAWLARLGRPERLAVLATADGLRQARRLADNLLQASRYAVQTGSELAARVLLAAIQVWRENPEVCTLATEHLGTGPVTGPIEARLAMDLATWHGSRGNRSASRALRSRIRTDDPATNGRLSWGAEVDEHDAGPTPGSLARLAALEADAGSRGDHELVAMCANSAARFHGWEGDFDRALSALKRALTAAEGHHRWAMVVLGNLGGVGLPQPRKEAIGYCHQSIALAERSGRTSPGARMNLGILLCDTGRLDEAREELLAAVRAADRSGAAFVAATSVGELSVVERRRGRFDAALDHLAEQTTRMKGFEAQMMVRVVSFERYADLYALTGRVPEAGTALAAQRAALTGTTAWAREGTRVGDALEGRLRIVSGEPVQGLVLLEQAARGSMEVARSGVVPEVVSWWLGAQLAVDGRIDATALEGVESRIVDGSHPDEVEWRLRRVDDEIRWVADSLRRAPPIASA